MSADLSDKGLEELERLAARRIGRCQSHVRPCPSDECAYARALVPLIQEVRELRSWIENLHTVVHGGHPLVHGECEPIYLKTPGGRASCASWYALQLHNRLSAAERERDAAREAMEYVAAELEEESPILPVVAAPVLRRAADRLRRAALSAPESKKGT